MKQYAGLQNDPITALATVPGESALAIIRLSGEGTINLLAAGFSRPGALLAAEGNTIVYGWLQHQNERIDEVTVSVFRAPKSYTGEESAEINCHGSLPGIQRIMSLMLSLGFRHAEPGEFTMRAFLNGKMDLSAAEAVHELVKSRSHRGQALALHRLSGGVFDEINRLKSRLVDLMAAVSVQLDYPDDELPGEDDDAQRIAGLIDPSILEDARSGLSRLSGTYRSGRLYQEGMRIALAGQTNAGKSSLFNYFLNEDRSIVSDVHGTTRDYIEAGVELEGIPLRLFDTAGLRDVDELVEAEGIRRSSEIIENSALILYLVDGSGDGPDETDLAHIEHIRELELPMLKLWTKSDTGGNAVPEGFIPVSVLRGEGFDELQSRIIGLIQSGVSAPMESGVMIDSLRQKHLIDQAVDHLQKAARSIDEAMPLDLIALDLQACLDSLGQITGEVSSEDILDRVFSGFCVGK